MVFPTPAATKLLIFSTFPLPAALETMVVTPAGFLVIAPPSPPVLIPAINVDMPVIVATFTIFGKPFPTIPLLFIYQPNTIDKAIALPGDVLLLSSVATSVEPLPTLM